MPKTKIKKEEARLECQRQRKAIQQENANGTKNTQMMEQTK